MFSTSILRIKMLYVHKSLPGVLKTLRENSELPEVEELLKIYNQFTTTNHCYAKQYQDRKSRAPFIVLEGLDGSGKTTAGNELSLKLNGVTRRTPPELLKGLRPMFDDYTVTLTRAFYALGNYMAGREVERLTVEKTPVIMDRFWHSTAAYAMGYLTDLDVKNLPAPGSDIYTWPTDLPKPDVVIYLMVNEDVRISRIEEAYRRMTDPAIIFVDGNESVDKVVDNCVDIIKSLDTLQSTH